MYLELNLQLRQTHEIRQEMHLELQQQILDLVPEFEQYITFETDDDIALLEASFPFLMLHELSHPLYAQGKISIPDLYVTQDFRSKIDQNPYLSSFIDHHAIEIGIDRSAILVGQACCRYSEEDMIHSNIAMIERVYMDVFEKKRILPEYGLIARLNAELCFYQEKTLTQELQSRIDKLSKQVKDHTRIKIPESLDLYERVVSSFKQIYQGTQISMKERDTPGLHEYFGARLTH